MDCGNCGRTNRDGSRFCVGCGNPLARRCPGCGEEAEPNAAFCGSCGGLLAAKVANHSPAPAAAPHGAATSQTAATSVERTVARKVVTIVFADLAGSTALHERLDAESAHRVMDGYYAAIHNVVAAHGGTVVKLLGDGVMAAFGVPRVAEDDAVRAVRAAVAMQEAFRELMHEQAVVLGQVGLRVAVNTGEVIVSGDHDDVVGDPVNVAARLQQEAQDGDVLIGEATQRLVANLVTLENFGTLTLKGRSEGVSAYRVVSLERPAGARTLTFVGRDDELRRIRSVYEAAVAARTARLVVVLGSPGLGKSRLISELARRLADEATIVSAQCDATGGSTFAPLVEALRTLLGLDDGDGDGADDGAGDSLGDDIVRAAIEARLPGEAADKARIAGGVAALLAGTAASPEETFFVVRRFLAAVAATQPLVLVFDDLQWAESLLLDLVEHLVQWSTDVPLLLLAAARPELRDARSSLTVPGGLVSGVVTLGGLDAVSATRLAANAIGADELPASVAGRVLASSEGNPLFVGELVRMLVHDGALRREGDRWVAGTDLASLEMPPTIQALLAARIERLRPEDRMVLERAAVVGRQFSRAAVAHLLASASTDLDARLESLRRSELIEPDSGWFLGEPALRFHHGLIRDAAYRRVLKGTRAELHERFADWLHGRIGDSIEHDETLGWHLEQAHQHLRELGPIGERGRAIGERASGHLAAAGRRALERDDLSLASSLLGRAIDRLDIDDAARAGLALDWCEALLSAGDVGPAATAVAELGRFTAGSDRLGAWHTCFAGQLAVLTDPATLRATADSLAKAAEVLASLGDTAGEAKAHATQATALGRLGEVGAAEAALDQALAAARRVGDRRRAQAVLAGAPTAALWGPSPVTRASGRCLDVVRVLRITQGAPAVEAVALRCQAVLEALRGRSEAARRMIATSHDMVEELGITQRLLEAEVFAGIIEWIEGDAAAAEQRLRPAYEGLRHHGLGIDAAQAAALLGRTLLAQDRAAEAEALSHESEALAGDDLKAAIAWRGVRAEALARRGEHPSAISLAREAVGMAAKTDALLDHADARLALAAALRAAGKAADADAEEARAIALWEAKGATVLAGRARGDGVGAQAVAAPAAPGQSRAPGRRRLRSNGATVNCTFFTERFKLGDIDPVMEQFANDYVSVHHPTGATYGLSETALSLRNVFRGQDVSFADEPLATLGDELALGRTLFRAEHAGGKKFDVGPHELEGLQLVEVDSQGKRRRLEQFRSDRLGDAVTRLYERRADLLPDGPDRVRAEGAAKTVAALTGDFDFDPTVARCSPTVIAVDNRSVGFGTLHGVEEVMRSFRALLELSEEYGSRTEDILAATDSGLLLHNVGFGITKLGGGAFERRILWLAGFAADGRIDRCEMFDVGYEDEALARFEELLGGTEAGCTVAVGTEPGGTEAAQTNPFVNAAWASFEKTLALIARHDWDGLDALVSQQYRVSERRKGIQLELDRTRGLQFTRHLLEGAQFHIPPGSMLGTRGDRLVLSQQAVVITAGNEGHVGPSEIEYLSVFEIDERGAPLAWVRFDLDDLEAAHAELQARYEAGEGSGHAAVRWLRGFPQSFNARDWDAHRDHVDAALDLYDYRPLMWGHVEGRAAVEKIVREIVKLAPDVRLVNLHGRTRGRFGLRETHYEGTRDGGPFEIAFLSVDEVTESGKVKRCETYPLERFDEARARFAALVAGRAAAPEGVASRLHNAATQAMGRMAAIWAQRDWAGYSNLFAAAFRLSDRRKMMQLELDREAFVEYIRQLGDMSSSRVVQLEVIATRGDRLALTRSAVEFAGGDVGPSEIAFLSVYETDERGAAVVWVRFDPDDMDAAWAEMESRYEAGEASKHPQVLAAMRSWIQAQSGRDWGAMGASLAPDFVFEDHRLLGFGTSLPDAAGFIRAQQALVELAPDVRYRADHCRLGERGWLRALSMTGTREGGVFENVWVAVVELDERHRVVRNDTYDLERFDDAQARFEQMAKGGGPGADLDAARRFEQIAREGGPDAGLLAADRCAAGTDARMLAAERTPNAATAAMDRFHAAFVARDWVAARAERGPDCRHEDRRRHVLVKLDNAEPEFEFLMATATGELNSRFERTAVGTAGERVALERHLWTFGPADGPMEIETLVLFEVDEHGRIADIVTFSVEDEADAKAEARTRWCAHDAKAAAGLGPLARDLVRWPSPDLQGMRSRFHEDVVVEDHRRTGFGRIDGIDAYRDTLVVLSQLSPDARFETPTRPLEWDWYGAVIPLRMVGTLADGGAFESEYILVGIAVAGLWARCETFEPEHVEAALARFRELRPNLLEIPPNAATRAFERGLRYADAQDWDALRELYAPVVMDDRRPLVGGPGDCETIVANARLIRHGETRWARTILATAGDRVVLYRNIFSTGPVCHPSEIETLSVLEVDVDGHVTGYIMFDPGDRAGASLELAERGIAGGFGQMLNRDVIRAIRHHDIAALREALPDGFQFNDRRRTGIGHFDDRDEYVNSVAALFKEAPDVIIGEILHVLAMDAGRHISVGHSFGTLASGGEFETVYLFVSSWSGRGSSSELFELEDIDAAWARYDEFGKAKD